MRAKLSRARDSVLVMMANFLLRRTSQGYRDRMELILGLGMEEYLKRLSEEMERA